MTIFICKFCSSERKNKLSLSKHQELCESNPNRRVTPFQDLEFQRTKLKTNQYIKANLLGLPKPELSEQTLIKMSKSSSERRHTDATKKRLSDLRKKFLTENPEKHPWKKSSKFTSHPCETLKLFLTDQNIKFESELDPRIEGRHFSIDIAFPDLKVGIEVNGRQHYDADGNLLDYYKKRHDLIEASGWRLIELYYTKCYDQKFIASMIDNLQLSDSINMYAGVSQRSSKPSLTE